MGASAVRLVAVDDSTLNRLLATAVDDADPNEVMAPVAGPSGWTPARREAFLAYHRDHRSSNDAMPGVEVTYAVVAGHDVAGALRLARVPDDPAALEVGLWLGRRHRGRRIAVAALTAAVELARHLGASTLVANTTPSNGAALALLSTSGFRIGDRTAQQISAALPLD